MSTKRINVYVLPTIITPYDIYMYGNRQIEKLQMYAFWLSRRKIIAIRKFEILVNTKSKHQYNWIGEWKY